MYKGHCITLISYSKLWDPKLHRIDEFNIQIYRAVGKGVAAILRIFQLIDDRSKNVATPENKCRWRHSKVNAADVVKMIYKFAHFYGRD